ncbi:MAG: cell division protein ZipA C-terminal FtsZ-binding domain-containing protein [Gammaproteobacteria bacterium]
MAELRWLLLVVGLAIVAGVYLFTRFKPRLEKRIGALAPRREPSIGGHNSAPQEPPVEPANDDPEQGFDESPNIPAPAESKIVAIRLMARNATGFPADRLILTMRELGLKHGEFGIFHRLCGEEDRYNAFSVASLVEPGAFDLTKIKTETYPGVSIFMMLPGAADGVEIFDDMLTTSRSLARELDGELLDEQGSSLSVQRERYLREEVIQFEHQATA